MVGTTLGARVTTASDRLPWVDVAKGGCILLVVLLHVTTFHLVRMHDVSGEIRDGWDLLGQWLRPVRMPLFFLLSGLLAAPALARRDPAALRRKVLRSAELYVIWLFVQSQVVDRQLRPGAEAVPLHGFVDALRMPSGSLWYLWALAAYVAALALVPPRWRAVALGGLAVVWLLVATKQWHLTPRPRDLLQYAVWFGAGAFVPHAVRGVAARFTDRRALVAVVAFAGSVAWLRTHGPIYAPLFQVLGVLAGLGCATQASGRLAVGLSALGRRTLSIYVLHIPLLTVWSHVVLPRVGWRGAAPVAGLLLAYPVVLGAALVAASLAIEDVLRRAGLGRLFGARTSPTVRRHGWIPRRALAPQHR